MPSSGILSSEANIRFQSKTNVWRSLFFISVDLSRASSVNSRSLSPVVRYRCINHNICRPVITSSRRPISRQYSSMVCRNRWLPVGMHLSTAVYTMPSKCLFGPQSARSLKSDLFTAETFPRIGWICRGIVDRSLGTSQPGLVFRSRFWERLQLNVILILAFVQLSRVWLVLQITSISKRSDIGKRMHIPVERNTRWTTFKEISSRMN